MGRSVSTPEKSLQKRGRVKSQTRPLFIRTPDGDGSKYSILKEEKFLSGRSLNYRYQTVLPLCEFSVNIEQSCTTVAFPYLFKD